jgi:hypothetical protein
MCGAPDQATIDNSRIPAGATVVQGLVYVSGEPLSGGYVRLLDSGGEFTAEVVTSATGQFRFFVRPGDWTVRVVPSKTGGGVTEVVSVADGEVGELRISI